MENHLESVIEGRKSDLGDHFIVRRFLPAKEKRMVGPFIFWDHMGPVTLKENAMTVRAHPHIGLATITWLFSGEILHRDSLNNEQPIRPGEVNWMTAGKGIVHSERSFPQEPPVVMEGIQLWLALPKEHEDIDPSFYHCKAKQLPKIEWPKIELTLIAGHAFDQKSPVPVFSPLFYLDAKCQKESTFTMPLKSNQEGAVYVASGEISVEGKSYGQFSMLTFKKESFLSFKALKESNVMIFGGEIFPEKRFIWWNFVSSKQEKIDQAKSRWKEGLFPVVINEKDIIPLPEY